MTEILSGPPRQKRKRLVSERHLRWVAKHQCVVCYEGELVEGPDEGRASSQATHISYLGEKYGYPKPFGGKVHDYLTVPQCPHCHDSQGRWPRGEQDYWAFCLIDPEPLALQLARASPDPRVVEFAKQYKADPE